MHEGTGMSTYAPAPNDDDSGDEVTYQNSFQSSHSVDDDVRYPQDDTYGIFARVNQTDLGKDYQYIKNSHEMMICIYLYYYFI